jgi:myosin heavy subunit
MDIGTEVWVKSDASVWAAGVVLDCQDMAATGAVKVKLNDTAEIVTKRYLGDGDDANELFLRNKRRDFESLSCLIGLEYLHEPALLHALSERFNHDRIYTSIGDILLAVNPFKDLPLYGDHIIQQYKDTMVANMRKNGMDEQAPLPHVFAIAGKAFSGLLKREAKNQAILVSGESGSGKTESTKFLMKFLTSVGHDFSSAANAANEHQTPAPTPPTSTRQKADSGDDEDEDDDVAAAGDSQEIGLRILQTNPILESFGNAQTIRNDNSSRFGKFIKIQFDAENQIVGAEIASYLLEKVRLLHQSSQERNFHIFYELLEGGDAALLSELGLERGHKYELLNAYGSTNTKATAATKRRSPFTALYSKRFKQTVQAFDDTGVEAVEREQIFQILAALLHLGNINFVMRAGGAAGSGGGGGGGGPEEAATVSEKSVHHIEKCAELLGVSVDNLQSLLLTREITAGNDVVTLKLNAEQSKDASRSFAKAIYGRLFTWLVSRLSDGINYRECLAPHEQHQIKTIGILDIFGFESLEQNGFEQLCINYANERLQAQFNEFVFVKEQHIYVSEGIDWRSISYPSNAACLALFDDKANGLFSLLDQECLIPKGSNQALTSKYYRYHGGAADIAENASQPQSGQKYTLPLLVTSFGRYLNQNSSSGNDKEDEKPKASDTPFSASKMDRVNHQFVIKHFAGRVRYDIDQFLEKNQDSLPTDACQMLTTSENEIVATIGAAETFEDAPDNGGRGRARSRSRGSLLRAPSVSFQFRGQLDTLLDEIGHTEAHYVRCLKPNEDKKPGGFDRHRMVEQLRSVGVLEALRIARAGYSARLPHATFAEMFACFRSKLTAAAGVKDMNNADTCKALLAVLVDEDNLEKKRTVGPPMRTLLRASNAKFNEAVQGYGVQLGRSIVFCKTTAYNDFISLRLRLRDQAVRTLQRICIGRFHRKRFLRMRSAALLIQRQTRRYQAILFVAGLRALRRRVAAYRIQRCMRFALLRMHEMDVKIRTHRLRRMFVHFRLGCSISKTEINEVVAEQEAEDVQEKEAEKEKEKEKEKEQPVVEKNHRRVRSSSDGTEDESTDRYSGGSRRGRSVSGSDDEDRRRAKARSGGKEDKQKRHASSRHQDHLSSEEPEREQTSEDRALRKEIERLQKMLGEQKTRSQHERKSRGGRSRVASLDAAHAAAAATRRFRTRRSSLDHSDTGDDELTTGGGGEHGSHGHQLPRRARTVIHVGRETDHVSKLTRRIEELDAKCRQLERLVARPSGGYDDRYPQIARNQGGWDRSLRRRRYSFANSDGSTGAYSDNSGYDAPSVAGGSTNAGVENLIWSIQQQMDMLRQSMVSKSEEEAAAAMQARHDAHTMSFASSQPTRSSTVTSNSSSVHPPFDGPLHEDAETDGYPRLPSPSRTNSDPNVGGSIYGGYHHMNGAMTPPTPASEASFHVGASSRHPAYPFAPPRVVKWSRNTHCHECNEAFTLFTRRHHCRMCGQSFCHEHSSRRVTLLGMGFDDEPQRVCDACFEEYQSQPVASPDYYGGRSTMTPTSVRSAAPPYGGHPGHHGPPPMFRQRSFSQQYYPPAPMHPQHNTPYGNHPPPPRYPTPYYGASPLPPHPAPPPVAAHSGMR